MRDQMPETNRTCDSANANANANTKYTMACYISPVGVVYLVVERHLKEK